MFPAKKNLNVMNEELGCIEQEFDEANLIKERYVLLFPHEPVKPVYINKLDEYRKM